VTAAAAATTHCGTPLAGAAAPRWRRDIGRRLAAERTRRGSCVGAARPDGTAKEHAADARRLSLEPPESAEVLAPRPDVVAPRIARRDHGRSADPLRRRRFLCSVLPSDGAGPAGAQRRRLPSSSRGRRRPPAAGTPLELCQGPAPRSGLRLTTHACFPLLAVVFIPVRGSHREPEPARFCRASGLLLIRHLEPWLPLVAVAVALPWVAPRTPGDVDLGCLLRRATSDAASL